MQTLVLFIKSLPRMWRNANRDMSRHFSMALSAIASIAIALSLAGFMAMVSLNITRFASRVENALQIQVSLQPAMTEQDRNNLGIHIQNIDGVESLSFSSKDVELEKLIQSNGEIFGQYKDANPLYDIFLVNVSDGSNLEAIASAIESFDGVVSAQSGGEEVYQIVSFFNSISLLAWIAIAGLIILGLFLIQNTISATIHLRKDEIIIMRQVGAYNFYITSPFVIQGMIIGFWAACVPIVLGSLLYLWIYHAFAGKLISSAFVLYKPTPFLLIVDLILLICGLLVGAAGSALAVRKTLKSIR